MPRNELNVRTIRTATSNKWQAKVKPQRFYNKTNTNQKTEVFGTSTVKWEDLK